MERKPEETRATADEIDRLARVVWDYHRLRQPLQPADCLFLLGSHDPRVAEWAVALYHRGLAPWLIFSGGFGRLTRQLFPVPEAEMFAAIARDRGVPAERILIENRSTNTGENIAFTRELLAARGLEFRRFLLVQKPYMERRAYATFRKVWPEKECACTSPPIAWPDYPTPAIPRDLIINAMVGDLQRIRCYPAQGFQIPQEIPATVWRAFERLVELGYDKHLITPAPAA